MELIVYEKSRELARIQWAGRRLTVGRRFDADIRINEPTMSAVHAEIFPSLEGVRVRDLESLNGTLLNGMRIVESLLRTGDEISVGRARIVVAEGDETAPVNAFLDHEEDIEPALTPNTEKLRIGLDLLRKKRDDDERIVLLRDLFETLRSVETADEVLRKVREVLRQAFPRARVFVLQPDENGDWRDQLGNEECCPSRTFAAEAARTNSVILSGSLTQDERFSASESARISGIQTAIAAPTRCENRPVAVLYVDRLGLPPFNPRDLHVLGIAANHVSAVLDNVARIAVLRRTNEELHEAREGLAEMNRNLEGLVEERTAEIRRQADEIARLAADKDELLGIAAHDIRSPLTVIQGTTELLQLRRGELEESTLNRSLELIHEAARGLSGLLSDLLDAKAIESGKMQLKRRSLRVSALLDEILPVARLAAQEKEILLVIEAAADLMIEADPQRLGQAINNLVLNAIKFSKPGTRIRVRGSNGRDGQAEIMVQDQGIGIPESELERIFDSFEQGKAGKAVGGSGLGLMIARRLVELHGGRLSVMSRVGVGTRFILSLPTSATAAAAISTP